MCKLRTFFTTIITAGFLFTGLADAAIVSTFVGAYAAEEILAGYTTSASVLPGEALKLRVRSTGT